jgi:L-serine dehydratase
MRKQPASIFNDVIGPVMRGPSSSHVAAAVRIGRLGRQMVKGKLTKVIVEFDPLGSLATTYHGHGSDMGLIGGLLGYEPQDEHLPKSIQIAKAEGLEVTFHIIPFEAPHPNTYRMTLISDLDERVFTSSISTGGGMIQFECIEDFAVSIGGDFYETLIFTKESGYSYHLEKWLLEQGVDVDYMAELASDSGWLIQLKTTKGLPLGLVKQLEARDLVKNVMTLSPVLPIQSSKHCKVPFLTAADMLAANEKNEPLWSLAADYESARGGISIQDVYDKMKNLVVLMDTSIKSGLIGTVYSDRLLGQQSHLIEEAVKQHKVLPGTVMNTAIQYITAMMEVKSSMGVIVAAPTAGSCGVLPGTIIGACNAMGLSLEVATKGMLAAGLVGLFIAEHATFAAEVGGCQVECGAGSAMAAAGLVEIMGGTAKEAIDAASMALQNVMGMVCDPVADRVEVPCLGKNVMAGANAIACATMALAGFDKVIPLDETIESMYKVGMMLPSELRCTGRGGLSTTATARKLYDKINRINS